MIELEENRENFGRIVIKNLHFCLVRELKTIYYLRYTILAYSFDHAITSKSDCEPNYIPYKLLVRPAHSFENLPQSMQNMQLKSLLGHAHR